MSNVLASRTPSYRLHKATGQAVVTLNGRDIYLGRYDTQESQRAYDALIAQWLANGRRFPSGGESHSVNEVVVAFWKHAESYYRGSMELGHYKRLPTCRSPAVGEHPGGRIRSSQPADCSGPHGFPGMGPKIDQYPPFPD
jgi:hypothetical protein